MTHRMAIWNAALQQAFPLSPTTRATFLEMRRGLASPQCVLLPVNKQLVGSQLDAVLAGETTVGSAMVEIIDVYRADCIDTDAFCGKFIPGDHVWVERVMQSLHRGVSAEAEFFSSSLWRDDASVFRERRIAFWGPTPFIATDARRVVNAALGLNEYDIADGKLIMGYLLFVAQQLGWSVRLCAGPSSQNDYFDMFTQRIRPIIVGPARAVIHGQMVHPLFALYHDLLHLVQIARQYPATTEGTAQHRAQIALYHRIEGALAAAGMENVEGYRYSDGLGFTLLSLLCEGAALDDERIPWGDTQNTILSALQAGQQAA